MNTINKIMMSLAIAAMTFTACSKNENVAAEPEAETLHISVKANAQDLSGEPGTKTYIGTYGETPNTIIWGTGEYMKLAVADPDGQNSRFGESGSEDADAYNGKAEATFHFSISPVNTLDSYLLMGLYPSSAAVASSNTNPASYKVSLSSLQNATASSYDPAAYIMVAKPEVKEASNMTEWKASYRRATALNKVTLKNLSEDIKKVKISAPAGVSIAGARHINLKSGESEDIYSGTNSIEVKFATPLTGGADMTIWFTSWGAEIPVGDHLTVVAYSDTHTFTRDITVANKSITFKEGYLNLLSINMASAVQDDNHELTAGNYLILAKNGDSYYALKAEQTDNRLVSVDYSGSTTSYTGDADLIWAISTTGSSYTISNGSNYLGWTSENTADFKALSEYAGEGNYLMSIDYNDGGTYKVYLTESSTRMLARNTGNAYFAFYTGSGYNDIVFVPANVDSRTPVTLSFAETSVTKTTDNYSEFSGLVVSSNPNVSDVTDNITYAITGNEIGTVNATTGLVTLNGSKGTATVTATFAGNENFQPAETSYNISVFSSGWEVLTSDDITTGSNTVQGTNNGLLAYRLGTKQNDGSLTFKSGLSAITFTIAGWSKSPHTFTITNGTIDDSNTLEPSSGSPSGDISEGFETSYSGTQYTIIVTDPTQPVTISGHRGVLWGFTADVRGVVNLSFATPSYQLILNSQEFNDFSAQAVTSSPVVSPIKYKINDENGVATGFNVNTGEFTLTGNTGTAIITATFEGNDDYAPAKASYSVMVTSSATSDHTATILFGNANGHVNVNRASVTGNDSENNVWTITTTGTTSFTPSTNYNQIGSKQNPASSITFTTTLSNSAIIKSISAKFAGAGNGSAGTIHLKVGNETVATGNISGKSSVTVTKSDLSISETVVTVTVDNIEEGIQAHEIIITYNN